MKRRFRRNPRQVPDTAELKDRELAARLPELEQRLRTATAALEEGCLAGVLPSDVRYRYHAVSDAYDAAVLAAEAGHRVAVGSTAGRPYTHVIAARRRPAALAARRVLEQLCTKRQGHLLDATLEVRIPTSVRVSSLAALGPHIPGMHFDPAQPLGPSVQRTYGIDLAAAMDARSTTTVSRAGQELVLALDPSVPMQPSGAHDRERPLSVLTRSGGRG